MISELRKRQELSLRFYRRRRRQRRLRTGEPSDRVRPILACCCWRPAPTATIHGCAFRSVMGRLFTDRRFNWCYQTEPQRECEGRNVIAPRGKVLGGSSAINGLIYIRGQAEDFDHWRQLGNVGWSYDDVLPYFRKAEDNERGAGCNSTAAEARLAFPTCATATHCARAYVEAAQQCGYPRNDDFNGAQQEGVGFYQTTMRNGARSSANTAYLRPARARANLNVVADALTTRVLFDGRRAIGVEYRVGDGTQRAHADREVIVSAGSFNSPQLLQLSGIGPATLLKQHGIEVIADRPAVGDNLSDHYFARLVLASEGAAVAQRRGETVASRRGGTISLCIVPARLFRNSSTRRRLLPACSADGGNAGRAMLIDAVFREGMGRRIASLLRGNGLVHACCGRKVAVMSASDRPIPRSRLRSIRITCPRRKIATRWLRDFKAMRRIVSAPAFAQHISEEIEPGPCGNERRRVARSYPSPRLDRLSSGRHVPHGSGRRRRR